MPNLAALTARNAARWSQANLTRAPEFTPVARKLMGSKARYQAVSAQTGVPWWVIAVIHQREASGSFAAVLHNGEKIVGTGRKTTLVPAGRGPFSTWEAAAIDALANCGPYAARNKDWSPGPTLTLLERYNGLGYANKGLPSPYVWSGTDQYVKGKYIRDGVFDANAVDQQLGCAGLILALRELDPSVRFADEIAATSPPVRPAPVQPPPPPPAPSPAPQTLIGKLLAVLLSIFKRS